MVATTPAVATASSPASGPPAPVPGTSTAVPAVSPRAHHGVMSISEVLPCLSAVGAVRAAGLLTYAANG